MRKNMRPSAEGGGGGERREKRASGPRLSSPGFIEELPKLLDEADQNLARLRGEDSTEKQGVLRGDLARMRPMIERAISRAGSVLKHIDNALASAEHTRQEGVLAPSPREVLRPEAHQPEEADMKQELVKLSSMRPSQLEEAIDAIRKKDPNHVEDLVTCIFKLKRGNEEDKSLLNTLSGIKPDGTPAKVLDYLFRASWEKIMKDQEELTHRVRSGQWR